MMMMMPTASQQLVVQLSIVSRETGLSRVTLVGTLTPVEGLRRALPISQCLYKVYSFNKIAAQIVR